MSSRRFSTTLSVLALAACAGTSHSAMPAEQQVRQVPFIVRSAAGTPEYLQGIAQVSPSAIDVLVTAARLSEDTPRAQLQRVRAELAEGDTARDWRATRRSEWVAINRLRALGNAPGGDTVRFHIARTNGIPLVERWLAFELAGQIKPLGMPPGEGIRPLHGTRGGLQGP